MFSRLRFPIALTVLVALCFQSHADAPTTIAFQGVLANALGVAQPDGDYTATFRLYDDIAAGNLLWTETDKIVTVAGGQGRFSTSLGDPTPFGLVFDQPYFLEVELSGEGVPMTPRIALASVPYALNTTTGSATLTLPFSGSTNAATAITLTNTGGSGIHSTTSSGRALWGTCTGASYAGYFDNTGNGIGMQGTSISNVGVGGISNSWYGVAGTSLSSIGVYGKGGTGSYGVYADAAAGGIALRGVSVSGRALWATCSGASYGAYVENTGTGIGVNVTSVSGTALGATSQSSYGVYGESLSNEGVRGIGHNVNHGAVVGINSSAGVGVYGQSQGGGYAGYFDGRCRVAVLEIAGGSDMAEKFDVSAQVEPGTVMAIDPSKPGALCMSTGRYNRKVAGIISGANNLSVGMVLPDVNGAKDAQPLAMSGRVWVKCDASNGAIEPGDLLTTSANPGRAMKATDYGKAMGASVGKAMTALDSGEGMVLVLVNLQ